jgi:hypothetical protein
MWRGNICLARLLFYSTFGQFSLPRQLSRLYPATSRGYDGYAWQKRQRSVGWWIKQFHKPPSFPQATTRPHNPALRGISLHIGYTHIHICIAHPPLQTFTPSQENIQHVTDFKPPWASKRNWKDLVFCQFITSHGCPDSEDFSVSFNIQQTGSTSLHNWQKKTCVISEESVCLLS